VNLVAEDTDGGGCWPRLSYRALAGSRENAARPGAAFLPGEARLRHMKELLLELAAGEQEPSALPAFLCIMSMQSRLRRERWESVLRN
jgi:hypothetical protein